SGYHTSKRFNYYRVAGVYPFIVFEQLIPFWKRFGYIRPLHGSRRAQNPASSLAGNVVHGRAPSVAAIPRGGDVNVRILRVERKARQRHVIFPTYEAPNAADRCINNPEAAGISKPPHHSFGVRRHQFSVSI